MAEFRRRYLLVAALVGAASVTSACNLAGSWVDRSGNLATFVVDGEGRIDAVSLYGNTPSWKKARGQASADGTSLWLAFSASNNQTGTLVNNCSAIAWPTGSVWGYASAETDPEISQVHFVFMAHLDLGYTNLARNVCDLYFEQLFPQNLALAQQLNGSSTPFALTTHPLLVAEYLDGLANCSHSTRTPAEVQSMQAAIEAGWVRWHAQSANYFLETMDAPGFNSMLRESDRLNAEFGQKWGSSLMKSTDVIGMSRSVIPLLNAAGRTAVHIGANAKCTMATLPQAFIWAHPETSTSVLALATNDYGGTVIVPPHVLIMQYQGDNSGPPSASQVEGYYAAAKKLYPDAKIQLSSLDDFAAAALSSPSAAQLPVISSEVGNSWLYGAPADPQKMSAFRETRRVIADAIAGDLPNQTQPLPPTDPNLVAFERRILIAGPEHNGGVSIGAYLPDARSPQGNWSNDLFHAVYERSDYQFVQSSYDEKRVLLEPLAPLQPNAAWSTFLEARQQRLDALTPSAPDISGFQPLTPPFTAITCGRLSVQFNQTDGALASLVDIASGHEWVPPINTSTVDGGDDGTTGGMLRFSYRTYTEENFTTFNTEYTPGCGVPCPNFAKQGMDTGVTAPLATEWLPSLQNLYYKAGSTGSGAACTFASQLAMDATLILSYGGMQTVWMVTEVDVDASLPAPMLNMQLQWFNKTLTRMAESTWMSFAPNTILSSSGNNDHSTASSSSAAASSTGSGAASAGAAAGASSQGRWWMDVLSSQVYPDDVALDGTRHTHAVWSGFGFNGSAVTPFTSTSGASGPSASSGSGGGVVSSFAVQTLDAFLVAPSDTNHLLHYDGKAMPDLSNGKGFHVNLHNNLWGTSFAQWNGDDALFRFSVGLQV